VATSSAVSVMVVVSFINGDPVLGSAQQTQCQHTAIGHDRGV
jgi:hypothetical protein